ncbi:DgyrCDS14554 [Dimorphilus gyrociliatus]|uniref:DgyrCDS14554 n=1 Tax=Dimorphilus gyrociliatus TaxID=2664684 RepID=A0A7I8WE13_9ANNE|nr:DgyrCDS14554 [Dimorphilus gyrociliatus]
MCIINFLLFLQYCQIGFSRLPFLHKDSETILLYDWYNETNFGPLLSSTKLYDNGGLNKYGTIFGTNCKMNKDGSVYFGFETYLKILHDSDFRANDFTVEIVTKYLLPANYPSTQKFYSFKKAGHLGLKVSMDGEGELVVSY